MTLPEPPSSQLSLLSAAPSAAPLEPQLLVSRHTAAAAVAVATVSGDTKWHWHQLVTRHPPATYSKCSVILWKTFSRAICCVPQTPSVLSRSNWRHFCLKERFHFKRIFYNIQTFVISTIYQHFLNFVIVIIKIIINYIYF